MPSTGIRDLVFVVTSSDWQESPPSDEGQLKFANSSGQTGNLFSRNTFHALVAQWHAGELEYLENFWFWLNIENTAFELYGNQPDLVKLFLYSLNIIYILIKYFLYFQQIVSIFSTNIFETLHLSGLENQHDPAL